MEHKIFLDTDTLIDFLRGDKTTINWLKENINDLGFFTTTINAYELYVRAFKSTEQEKKIILIDELLNELTIEDINTKVAKLAGKKRAILETKGDVIDHRDVLIAAITIFNNGKLKTNNRNHFLRIDGLNVLE